MDASEGSEGSALAAVTATAPGAAYDLLKPEVLASLSNLELVARAAVHGFLNGLHRSPLFGFSQEFVEYRAYAEGDDPRFVDWNVYARTERTYIKRYLGETNTRLVILLDASASMGYGSGDDHQSCSTPSTWPRPWRILPPNSTTPWA